MAAIKIKKKGKVVHLPKQYAVEAKHPAFLTSEIDDS